MKRNRKIESMLETIRNRGGIVGVSDRLSDEVAEFFLQEVLDCPDCLAQAQRAGNLPAPRRRSEH